MTTAPDRTDQPWPVNPMHVVAALVGALSLWFAAGPLRDLDSFWHVQLGADIARLHRVDNLPAWWLSVRQPDGWLTSQWLSELGMHAATDAGGWRALMFINIMLMFALVTGLMITLLPGRPALVAVPLFVVVLVGSYGGIQQRPQAISIVLLPWLAVASHRLLTDRGRPPLWLIALVSLVWAQLHGLWILAPAAFALVVAGSVLDAPRLRDAAIRARTRAALACLVASLAGIANPHGPGSFLLPFRFKAATAQITEWWPTTFALFSFSLGLLAVLLATFVAWARSPGAVPRSEILWVLVWMVFALQSFRNVSPALLLIAPVSLAAVLRATGDRVGRASAPAGRRESQVLAGAVAVVLLGGLVLAVGRAGSIDPLSRTPGTAMADWVARQPGPVRVFNTYNAAGAMIGLSDHKARLVIDGRADLWSASYIDKIRNIEDLRPGWRPALIAFHPDVVVTQRDSALVSALTSPSLSSSRWRVELTDRDFTLLVPDHDGDRTDPAKP